MWWSQANQFQSSCFITKSVYAHVKSCIFWADCSLPTSWGYYDAGIVSDNGMLSPQLLSSGMGRMVVKCVTWFRFSCYDWEGSWLAIALFRRFGHNLGICNYHSWEENLRWPLHTADSRKRWKVEEERRRPSKHISLADNISQGSMFVQLAYDELMKKGKLCNRLQRGMFCATLKLTRLPLIWNAWRMGAFSADTLVVTFPACHAI